MLRLYLHLFIVVVLQHCSYIVYNTVLYRLRYIQLNNTIQYENVIKDKNYYNTIVHHTINGIWENSALKYNHIHATDANVIRPLCLV